MKPVHTPALYHVSVSEALPFHHHWHCIGLQCLIDCDCLLAALSAPVHWTFTEYLPHLRLFCPYFLLCVGVSELTALQTVPAWAFNWFHVSMCVCVHARTYTHMQINIFLIFTHLHNINMFALVFLLDSFLPHWLVHKTKVLSSALIFVLYEL